MSKIGTLILGLLKEKPLNPYEITKVLEIIKISQWYTIGNSTIYATIKNLSKNGLVEGCVKKEGNMPPKTIYSITEKGKKIFEENLIKYLSSTDFNPVEYNIGCIFICHIQKEKVLELLQKKEITLSQKLSRLNDEFVNMNNNNAVPEVALFTIIHSKYLIDAEIKTTKELIEKVIENKGWNNFIIKDFNI